ncbi:GDP-fucose transporter 1 [Orchesella cincta]|uniref:GDP-fucose transporter 1 n=1 Tax=Orchesella cincta TaxID=48709 RepID=A0A1D2NE75_ORCCI|nr:GDP-fucose transporter 1 [Orchesella cincta]
MGSPGEQEGQLPYVNEYLFIGTVPLRHIGSLLVSNKILMLLMFVTWFPIAFLHSSFVCSLRNSVVVCHLATSIDFPDIKINLKTMLRRSSVTNKAILCCVIITILGYLIESTKKAYSGGITTYGIVYGLLSSCFVFLNSILHQKVLPAVDNSVWALTLYNKLQCQPAVSTSSCSCSKSCLISSFVSQIQEFISGC